MKGTCRALRAVACLYSIMDNRDAPSREGRDAIAPLMMMARPNLSGCLGYVHCPF